MMLRTIGFFSVMLISTVVFGDGSYGEIADSMMGPIKGLIAVLDSISIICGIGMIMGSFFKYLSYRKNSSQTTIGTPIVMFLAGVGLVLLGLVPFGAQ
jgi:hypothetical protein